MTFKLGDRVVTIPSLNLSKNQEKLIGQVSTITRIAGDYWQTDDGTIGYLDHEIVLEEVYNSPLYQAMKEEI